MTDTPSPMDIKTNPKIVHINAFPKSGVTWLTHLVCDLLDSPQHGVEIKKPLVWGVRSGGGYKVVKHHCQLKDKQNGGVWLFLQRDPRDVIVSKFFYQGGRRGQSLEGAARNVIKWYKMWLMPWLSTENSFDISTRYESLHSHPARELGRIGRAVTGATIPDSRILETIERQSFRNMAKVMDGHFMRKGIVGDWQNYFDKKTAKLVNDELGDFMLEQGYVEDGMEWWRVLE